MKISSDIVQAFTAPGTLRAAINLGNPILAHRDADSGQAAGVSVDLAHELARQMGVALELRIFDAAGKSVEAVTREEADIGFFAVDPLRGEGIAFTAPYVLIEGCYLVRADSPIEHKDEVDRSDQVVVVGKGSAYDLFLSRELSHAKILRSPTSPSVVDTFVKAAADVAAGVRQQLEADARRLGGLRLLDGRFMVIQQAMGMPKGRGQAAAAALAAFVETMKDSGFVADALRRHGIEGASVAPLDLRH